MNYTLEDIKKQSPYPIGELNTAYAKYFVGNSYKFVAKNPHACVWDESRFFYEKTIFLLFDISMEQYIV